MSHQDIKKPEYSDFNRGGIKNFRRYLRQGIRSRGLATEQQDRADAYNVIGSQQAEASRVGGQAVGASMGWGNESGLASSLERRVAVEGDYAGANLAAKNAARNVTLQFGQALEGSKQNQANWYSTLAAPYLSEQGTLASYAAQAGAAEGAAKAQKYQLIGSILGSVGSGVTAYFGSGA